MKQPLSFIDTSTPRIVPCAFALMAGIIWQTYYPLYHVILFLFFLTLLHYLTYKNNYLLILSLFFIIGFSTHWYRLHLFESFQERVCGGTFDIRGTIENLEGSNKNRTKQILFLSMDQIKELGATTWEPCSGLLQLQLTLPIDNLRSKDFIELKNITFKHSPNNSFSYYLIKEHILGSLFVEKLDYKLLYRPRFSLKRILLERRTSLFQECKNKLSKKTFSLFSLIFLGNKTVEKKELQTYRKQFNLWGISHHLARSGLHLLLLIIVFQAILPTLTTSFLVQQIVLFCIVILYTALSWISISYTRALITFVFYTCCNLLKLPVKLLSIIALVAIIVLVLNPAQLFFLDFQLSFGLTFALGWLNHIKKNEALRNGN